MSTLKQQEIPIKGMHCRSCEIMITEHLEKLPDVQKADVSLRTKTATVYAKRMPSQPVLRTAIQKAGYDIGYEKLPWFAGSQRIYRDLGIGLLVVALLAVIYNAFELERVSNIGITGAGIGVVALVLGLTAGFSTCMALIGGLVLGISARHAEKHPTASPMQKFRPHLFFNLGRIVSFIVFGALIGAAGSAFQLQGVWLGLLTIFVGIVMFMLGLQLTEVFPRVSNGGLTLPSGLAKMLGIKKRGEREYSHTDSVLVGALTFFLPCGFTQAMQLLAISTGSPAQGALIMGAFAIGTAPGLLGVGGLTAVVKGAFAQRFFRIVGVAVVAMALLNITNGYNLLGVGNPFSRISAAVSSQQETSGKPGEPVTPYAGDPITLKTVYTLDEDIIPSKFETKVGAPTTMVVDVKDEGVGCMSTIMIPGLDDQPQFLKRNKKLELTFTPKRAGTYQITCAMGVPRGTLEVI